MRVLVTGGAGYIGSIVAEELVRFGYHTVVYDNLVKGHRDAVRPPAELVEGDLLDTDRVRATLRQHRIDAVIHMAAESLVGESMIDPGRYYRANVLGGLSLLEAMTATEVGTLVFSSTAAVYGEPAKQPIEESDPTRPSNTYGETKLAFERALAWFERAHGLRYVSLRYFNAAGASEHNGERHHPETHLIPLVLQAAAGQRREVAVYGDDYPTPDGTCVRDYIHVLDLARAHVLAMNALTDGAESAIYNLGCGGAGYSVKEVIAVAERVTGRRIPVTISARRAGDPAVLIASSARIVRELKWAPARQALAAIIESAWRWLASARPGSEQPAHR
ncbi:MAG TPA: UDP-glucose 4-epimerase GalE [Kofleriaceae bacterium]|nr:UDP-glucose 4-epimerase GalE [Kofleriaceae bacterium]